MIKKGSHTVSRLYIYSLGPNHVKCVLLPPRGAEVTFRQSFFVLKPASRSIPQPRLNSALNLMAVTSKQERPCHSQHPTLGQLQMPFLRYHEFLSGKKDRALTEFFLRNNCIYWRHFFKWAEMNILSFQCLFLLLRSQIITKRSVCVSKTQNSFGGIFDSLSLSVNNSLDRVHRVNPLWAIRPS